MREETLDAATRRRLLVIGLDGVPPDFLFDRFRSVMPQVSEFVDAGVRAPLRTTDPPISIPAWPVMFTGVDPGTLGCYGFRHRKGVSYTETYVPDSTQIPVPTVWQLASEAGRRVCVIGMPSGYPPIPVNGVFISDFLTPPGAKDYTYPIELAAELEREFGPYPFDVVFRSGERDRLFGQLLQMMEVRFQIAERLMARESWDLFGIHEIGTDRLHHAYWKYFDHRHPSFVPGNPHSNAALEYYRRLDLAIGRLIRAAGPNVAVLIVSDHGCMAMEGLVCINQWLLENGYLAVKGPVAPGTPLDKAPVDWDRTTVWGSGGYYARIFFNIRGREARGIVAPSQIPVLRRRLEQSLASLKDPLGRPIPVRVLDPRAIYAQVRGDPPDLIVYFDELRWRAAGTLGYPEPFLKENDTGPDDAVHSFDGVFLWFNPSDKSRPAQLSLQQIRDVAPTILQYLGLPLPDHLQSRPIALGEPRPATPPGGVPVQS